MNAQQIQAMQSTSYIILKEQKVDPM